MMFFVLTSKTTVCDAQTEHVFERVEGIFSDLDEAKDSQMKALLEAQHSENRIVFDIVMQEVTDFRSPCAMVNLHDLVDVFTQILFEEEYSIRKKHRRTFKRGMEQAFLCALEEIFDDYLDDFFENGNYSTPRSVKEVWEQKIARDWSDYRFF